MKLFHIALLASIALPACPKDPIPPTPDADAGGTDAGDVDALAPATCVGWCLHAAVLHCPAAQDTPKGGHCVDVCTNVQTNGAHPFNLSCRVAAKTCDDAEKCER